MTKTCRKCGTAFSEDLTTCPVCKTVIIQEEPNQPASNVTASYAFLKDSLELVTLKSRHLTSLFFFLLGFTGLGFFYLKKKTIGLITLFVSVSLLTIAWFWLPNIAFEISLGMFLIQTIIALYYLFNPDAKDGRGELLK
jgi:hypothetical protein